MCNPPFYSSKADLEASYANKDTPPSAICTGAEVEMICEGGDVGFVMQMVEESMILQTKVQWYTSMFGKLSSAYKIVDRLKELGISNWAVACLRAGNKTKRWAVAWSFEDRRPRHVSCPSVFIPYLNLKSSLLTSKSCLLIVYQDVARSGDLPNTFHPLPTAQTIYTSELSTGEAADLLNSTLMPLDLVWNWDTNTLSGHGSAKANVWSRSARRKQKRGTTSDGQTIGNQTNMDQDMGGPDENKEVALAFKISLTENGAMEVRWLRGRDYVLFESFCGMLKRGVKPKV